MGSRSLFVDHISSTSFDASCPRSPTMGRKSSRRKKDAPPPARSRMLSSRSFFPSTTPLYQLLALFGGYRRSRPQPDTPPPLPRTTSRLILRTRLAAPSSLFLRWPHQDLRHSGSTIATRPTRPRTARRPAQELAARGGVRGPKTHLEPPRSRASNRSAHLEGLDRSPTYPAATATSLPVFVDLCDPFGSGMGSR